MRLNIEQKREQAVIDLINQMFIIAGHQVPYDDVLGKENWFQEYTMTEAQNAEWREWGVKFISKKRRLGDKLASREMAWLDVYCGLKISDSRFNNEEL